MVGYSGTGDPVDFNNSTVNDNDYDLQYYKYVTEIFDDSRCKILIDIEKEIELQELRFYWPIYLVLHNFRTRIIKSKTRRMIHRKISIENIGCRNFKKQR